jgi:hypothetical protein
LVLQPTEGNIRFHPHLLCMLAFQNSYTAGAAMRLQIRTWSA